MQDDPHKIALDLCARATVHRLKADADELAELFASLSEAERERLSVLLFGAEV